MGLKIVTVPYCLDPVSGNTMVNISLLSRQTSHPYLHCSKYSEFALWASEAKRIDIEVLPKLEERELFRTFCEDFNTATLPHRKFYNLQEYHRKKEEEKAAQRGSSDVSPLHQHSFLITY